MTEGERQQYVGYRMESARRTYEAAKILAANGFWNSAVNRLGSSGQCSNKLIGH